MHRGGALSDARARTAVADAMIGTTLDGRWAIRRRVGEGKTGVVYAAQDGAQRVAVKLLHTTLCAVDEQVKRYAREFAITSRVRHPNVVEMYAFGRTPEGRHFLVMEFLEGRQLSTMLADGQRFGADRASAFGIAVAEALAAAHAHGVVHRDLNAENVMWCKQRGAPERIKVLDFGLARLLEGDGEEDLTAAGVRVGSPGCMAPEYIRGKQLDARSDLYALGALLYHMVTGAPPFVGSSLTVLESHVSKPPTPPSSRAPGVPPWCDTLVLQLLEKDPARRPADATAVAVALRNGLASLPAREEPPRSAAPRDPPTSAAPVSSGVAHAIPASRPPPSNAPLVREGGRVEAPGWLPFTAAVGGGLLLAALVAAWLLFGGRP